MQQPIIAQKFMVGDQAFNTRAEAADFIYFHSAVRIEPALDFIVV